MQELTEEEVARLAEALGALKLQLEEALVLAREGARPVALDQQAVGRVSRMDAMQQQALAASSRRSLELRLEQVKGALRAIDEGEYGVCRRCEEPIGFGRLSARPEAGLCVACQGGGERG